MGSARGWGTPIAGIALVVIYVVLRVFAGFWPALIVTGAGAVLLFVVRVVGGVIDEATRPPRDHGRRG